MRITNFDIWIVNAGWRDWLLLEITTSDGVTGVAEFTESNGLPGSLVVAVSELLGRYGHRSFDSPIELKDSLTRSCLQSSGGIAKKAISAIENAAWDAMSKSTKKTISALFGIGNEAIKNQLSNEVYWSHFPTTRVRASSHANTPEIRGRTDLFELGVQLEKNQISIFKSNILDLSQQRAVMPGFSLDVTPKISMEHLAHTAEMLQAIREGSGFLASPALDLNFNVQAAGLSSSEIAVLEALELAWLEIDTLNFNELEALKGSGFRICSGENLLSIKDFETLVQSGFVDIISVDLLWLGLSDALEVAKSATKHGVTLALHNYYSHFATAMALTFSNFDTVTVPLLEFDPDDVPWRSSVCFETFNIENSTIGVQGSLGWSCTLNKDFLMSSKHVQKFEPRLGLLPLSEFTT